MINPTKVIQHYGQMDLRDRLASALEASGLGTGELSPEMLAPLDQFHTRGLAATIELAQAATIGVQTKVLDIGSGLGGPSRYLAATFGCRVDGIDLSPAYVTAASYLAVRSGLNAKVRYECANALDLPCDSETYDVAWTQHVAMNIADRKCLYREAFRVLKKGGRLAIYDVVIGNGEPLHFPVPWSREPATSFLLSQEDMRATLGAAGFRILDWADRTAAAREWFDERRKASAALASAPQALGLHVAMGPEIGSMVGNLGRNLAEGRVAIVQVIAERPQ